MDHPNQSKCSMVIITSSLVQRAKDTNKSFMVIKSRDSSATSRERKADVHINMFADASCIAQHPHDYDTVSSAGVPLQFSDALLWSPYQNNPVFHPRKCDCVEGRFWTEVESELGHVPATCLAFMLSMIIWCCSDQSNWQPQFLRVQISRREEPEPEQNRSLKGRNLDLIF